MSRKLILVNPSNQLRRGFMNHSSTSFMPLGLGIVAAMTPADWEIELIDESFEEFNLKPADLVALTGFTANVPRAYEIAAICRRAGIHTVMGGIHASMLPSEVRQYVDTVFTGEAEGAWPRLIRDFESGNIQGFYDGGIVDIGKISAPRRDIFEKYPYVYDSVQTSRGCPMGCDFCSVTQMCGKSYRERPVKDVLDELAGTSRLTLFFVDDNLVNNKKGAEERAIELFKGMIARKFRKRWFSQAALNFADNPEVLRWARKSGCMMILVGIEAETPEALKSMRKNLNLKRGVGSYVAAFRRLHRHGISVLASMIFGLETDTVADLRARRDFIRNCSADTYQCTILTPMPGTVLYQRLEAGNRIVRNNYPADWQHYDAMEATVNTPVLSRPEIEKEMKAIWYSLYNKEAMRRKMFRTLWNTRSLRTAFWGYASLHNYARMFLESYLDQDPDGLDKEFYWKNRKRSLYLRCTHIIVLIFYKLYWHHLMKRVRGIT